MPVVGLLPTNKKKLYKFKERSCTLNTTITLRALLKVLKPKKFRFFFKTFSFNRVFDFNTNIFFQNFIKILENYILNLLPTVGLLYKFTLLKKKKYLFKQFFLVKPKYILLKGESSVSFALKYLNIDFNIFFKTRIFILEKSWGFAFNLFIGKLIQTPNRLPGALLKKYIAASYKKLKIKSGSKFNV